MLSNLPDDIIVYGICAYWEDEDRMKIGDLYPHLKKKITLDTEYYYPEKIYTCEYRKIKWQVRPHFLQGKNLTK